MPEGSQLRLRRAAEADISAPDTDQSTLYMDDDDGGAPHWRDDANIDHTLEGAPAPALTYQDHGNTGSTETVDASAADIHRLVANAATVTLTLTGAPAAGTPGVIRLWLEQDGTGGRDWVFPGSVDFGDPGEPDWTTRSGGAIDLVDLMTVDGGTVWEAALAGRQGPAGAAGDDGVDGTTGGAIVIDYTFSTTTTDSDPGNGNLRLSNATQNAAAVIRTDLLDAHGATRTSTLDSLDDSTNTVKGHLRLFKTDDPTKFLLFTLTSIATPSGYRNITVVNVDSSTSSPFSNGDPVTLAFSRAGDVGASGTASVGSDPIWDAKGDLAAGTGADTAAKVTVGANDTTLLADSAQSTGMKWGHPILTTLEAFLTSDTACSTANSYTDACSVTLSVGTWLLVGHVSVQSTAGAAGKWFARLWDGTNVGCEAQGESDEATGTGHNAIPLEALVVVASGTPTWKISACSDGGTSNSKMLATMSANGTTNKATHLVAIRVA